MNSEKDRLINLAVHESSDPEMLERDAASKAGSSESTDPEMLDRNTDLEASANLDDFNHDYEGEREGDRIPDDFDVSGDAKAAERQIGIVNRHAG